MKKGDIVCLMDNVPEWIKKRASKAMYNGFAVITDVTDDTVTVMCLYGLDTSRGTQTISHPIRYNVDGDDWFCLTD